MRRRSTEFRNGDPQQTINIFAGTNRGMLLDVLVFVLNIFLMRLLARQYVTLFRQADGGDKFAKLALGLTLAGMLVLPAVGAVLKRWHFHQRLRARGKEFNSDDMPSAGCLFNPILYFCLNLVLSMSVAAIFYERFFGDDSQNKNGFLPFIFLALGFAIFQTFLIYRYFSPPKAAPRISFLRAPQSEIIGDACFFLNMVFFQIAWNLLTFAPRGRVSGVGDLAGRVFFLSFTALLFYFPPRIFHLAEDIKRPRTWLTILLANSPVIIGTFFRHG